MPRDAISLDPRLEAIAGMCGKCDIFADIGCDHGRLGAYMLQTNLCEIAYFTELSSVSLDKARRLVGTLGLSARARFLLCDGADALDIMPGVAAISGMGGETISGIIERGIDKLGGARLTLQPNINAPQLRIALEKLGFRIDDEKIARDGRRLYVIISASPGIAEYTDFEREVGPILAKTRPAELFDFADFRLRVAKNALRGRIEADDDCADLRREIEIWEEVAAWR